MKRSLGVTSHTYGNRTVLSASAAHDPLVTQLLQGQSSHGNKDYTAMPSVGYHLILNPGIKASTKWDEGEIQKLFNS